MFCIKIAGLCIGIDNKYDLVLRVCRDYICREIPAFSVIAEEDEIDYEISLAQREVSRAYAESICIYRKICQKLPEYDGFLFHSSVVECDGVSYAFAAASGTGKSTHTALWLKYFGDRARIINGDKPIFRFDGEKMIACGTPWCGKEGFNINTDSPVRAVCFIERGEKNEICKLSPADALMRVFSQILLPQKEQGIDLLFPLLDKMLKTTPCYLLKCTISEEAVRVAYEAMK